MKPGQFLAAAAFGLLGIFWVGAITHDALTQKTPTTTTTTLSVEAQTALCDLGYCEPGDEGPADGGYR